MADALQNPVPKPEYLGYFEIDQAPFARLADPDSIFHAEQYALLMNRLAETRSGTDNLLVLRGVDGSGKTTLLNRFLGGLDEEQSFASIDEKCNSADAFYRSFLEQIGFKNIDGKLEELRSITREFLVHRTVVDDTVLLIIDNTQRIHPAVYEQLRWLGGIKHRDQRVLSVVLAGNSNLGHILDSPAMTGLTFSNRVDFHIRAYSEKETADYVQHRLFQAGAMDKIAFAPEALALIYRFSGGIPRWINRICSLLLDAACVRQTREIDDALVRAVAEAEQLPANVFPLKSRGRRKTDTDEILPVADGEEEEHIQKRQAAAQNSRRERISASPDPDVNVARLFDQIAELSEQIGKLKADKAEAEKEIEARDLDISGLREALALKEESLESDALDRQRLSESLEQQKNAARHARTEATRARNRIEKLEATRAELEETSTQLRSELQAAEIQAQRVAELEEVSNQLQSELQAAEMRAQRVAELEEASTRLRSDLQEAEKQAQRVAELEQQLDKTEDEKTSLLKSMAELEELRDQIAERDSNIAMLKQEIADLAASSIITQPRLAEMPDEVEGKKDESAAIPEKSVSAVTALEIMRRGKIEQVFDIKPGTARIMIGRGADSDLKLDSTFVSRHHALVFCRPTETYVEDLNSFNGTIVNGRTVSSCDLKPGDSIIIGEFLVRPIAAGRS